MNQRPDFDPFELLGVDASADASTIDRAYKARIRYVHPDIAGEAGLDEAKRLNVAREWLLDPDRRAQLPRSSRSWRFGRAASPSPPSPPSPPPEPSSEPPPRSSPQPPPPPSWERAEPARPPKPAWEYDPLDDDPLTFDLGSQTTRLRAFFDTIRSLSVDERARVTYSLGDEPPIFFDVFKDRIGEQLWARSRALNDAIHRVWGEREDESAPLLFPRGRVFGHGAVVANAYAQWMLLGDVIRTFPGGEKGAAIVESRCTSAWLASVGHVRYGRYEREVLAFLKEAQGLSAQTAERLARSWERHFGEYLYGRPGEDWFPGALDHADPDLVSARLAAVDASRIEPPADLPWQRHNGCRCGLRLTAHVLALGGGQIQGRDYLRPWQDALVVNPTFWERARYGMPPG